MHVTRLTVLFLSLASWTLLVSAGGDFDWNDVTPLDTYVHNDDGYYSYEYITVYNYDGVSVYVVNMTSQKYMNEELVTPSVWWHIMSIAIPDKIRHYDHGILYIGSGNNPDPIPDSGNIVNTGMASMANDTGMCAAYLGQVPNQPTIYSLDPDQKSRREDSIIAFSWVHYGGLSIQDPNVILRMPMTKAAKSGLDCIRDVAKDQNPLINIDKYFVTGASKRGWTTWSIAATDQRVIAIMPMVFSMLNMYETMMAHYQNMDGGWSFAFGPYYNENITTQYYNPVADSLFDVEDMFRYRRRLEGVYKLEVLSSGDEFFLCDDTLNWWDEMTEPKWMLMLPNAEHIMAPHYLEIYETAVSFIISVIEGYPLPTFTWTLQEVVGGGTILMQADPPPVEVVPWNATTLSTDTRRDFRLAAKNELGDTVFHPVGWRNTDLTIESLGNGMYRLNAWMVPGEWNGFFVQAKWIGPPPHYYILTLTTQVNVIPWTRPRPPCETDAECYGYLV